MPRYKKIFSLSLVMGGFWWLAMLATPLSINAASLSELAQGQVIQISPQEGTYMCSDQNCAGDGAEAEPYKLMFTGIVDENGTPEIEDDAAYFVMLDNYCAWRSADCTYNSAKLWNGSSWNTTTGNEAYSDLGGYRQTYNILVQLNNFYNTLPETVAGITKSTAIPTKSFDMTPIAEMAASYKACNTTTNSVPYGNISATFSSSPCSWASKVTLLSYDEWQGKSGDLPSQEYHFPEVGTIGYAFCQTRFGTDCTNDGAYGLFLNEVIKNPHMPWTRTPMNEDSVWRIDAQDSNYSMYGGNSTPSRRGILPSLYLSSTLSTTCGEGTYDEPYHLVSDDCPVTDTAPIMEIMNGEVNLRAYPNTIIEIPLSVTDPDLGEELTITASLGLHGEKTETLVSTDSADLIMNKGVIFSWKGDELPVGVYGNDPSSLANLEFRVVDSKGNEAGAIYQGSITILDEPDYIGNEEIVSLYTSSFSRFSGAIFFPVKTKPNMMDRVSHTLTTTNPKANDYYCYDDTGCINLVSNSLSADSLPTTHSAQIWYKDIADTQYPFMVQFYEQPLSKDELRINDGEW